jgi:hypothetical protein
MDLESTHCAAATDLTDDQVARLNAAPDADHHLVETKLGCEVRQTGHPGVHLALAQAAGDAELWLLWGDAGPREFKVLPPCVAEDVELGEVCTLPLQHPGLHSFA